MEEIIYLDMDGVVIKEEAIKENVELLVKEFKKKRDTIDSGELFSLFGKYPFFGKFLAGGWIFGDRDITRAIEVLKNIDEREYPSLANFLITSKSWRNFLKNAEFTEKGMPTLKEIIKICKENGRKVGLLSRRMVNDMDMIVELLKRESIEIEKQDIYLRSSLEVSEIEHKRLIMENPSAIVLFDNSKKVVEVIDKAVLFKDWKGVKEHLKVLNIMT